MAGHTATGCRISSPLRLASGDTTSVAGDMHDADCGPHDFNVGCTFFAPAHKPSYGDAFNAVGGGVYAMEWTSDQLRIWHFPRGAVPGDLSRDGAVGSFFRNMRVVLNINFCGDYGEATWARAGGGASGKEGGGGGGESCMARLEGESCRHYVANNPQAFGDAYWGVNYINVYQRGKVATQVRVGAEDSSSSSLSDGAGASAANTSPVPPDRGPPHPLRAAPPPRARCPPPPPPPPSTAPRASASTRSSGASSPPTAFPGSSSWALTRRP
jgi:hypothetical protein